SGGSEAERSGRGAGGEVEYGSACAERRLVWRADDESVAAGGGIVGIERGAGCGGCGGAGWVCDWQRDTGKHCESNDAVWDYRAAADVWARAAHRRDDLELDLRQAGTDGAIGGRYDACAGSDQRL